MRWIPLAAFLALAIPARASAQDVLSLTPPEMEALVEELDRPEGADALRLGIQFDLEKEVTLLAINLAGTAVWRPHRLAVRSEAVRARPQGALRLRSPVSGSERQSAFRTVTSGPVASLELAYTLEGRMVGDLWLFGRAEGSIGIQQAGVPRETTEDAEPAERFLTAGVMSAGPRTGLVYGPALLAVDLMWHRVWFGSQTFQVFEEVLEDGPYFGVSFVLRFSSHLFAHFRVLPRIDDPLPKERWTVGIAGSFDPLHD